MAGEHWATIRPILRPCQLENDEQNGEAMTGSYNTTATKEERTRKSIEFQIMTMLNHAQRHGANVIFDCGERGMCHVYWHKGSWCANWIATEKFEPLILESDSTP